MHAAFFTPAINLWRNVLPFMPENSEIRIGYGSCTPMIVPFPIGKRSSTGWILISFHSLVSPIRCLTGCACLRLSRQAFSLKGLDSQVRALGYGASRLCSKRFVKLLEDAWITTPAAADNWR